MVVEMKVEGWHGTIGLASNNPCHVLIKIRYTPFGDSAFRHIVSLAVRVKQEFLRTDMGTAYQHFAQ